MEAASVRLIDSAISAVAADALLKSRTPVGEAAYRVWCERVGGAATTLQRETFASEAAFAAVARLMLDEKLGAQAARFQGAFPHLYCSTSFAWYELDQSLRGAVLAEMAGHGEQEPGELLGWLYQFVVPLEVRRQFGQFYTGAPVVRSMLDGAGYAGARVLGKRLIDPACGAGAFLVEASRRQIAAARAARLNAEECCAAVQRAIHGLDLNAMGVLLTEAAIALLLAPLLAETDPSFKLEPLRLHVTDSLRRAQLDDLAAEPRQLSEIKNRAGGYESGFDFVVANPPYAKFPTRLMTVEQRTRFAATTYGHPNLYGLFLQAGVELLAQGGRLAYINPKSFVSGQYFQNLRRFLARELDIERFDTFAARSGLFEGVLQEVVILHARRSAGQREKIELREYGGESESGSKSGPAGWGSGSDATARLPEPDRPAFRSVRVPAGSVLLPDSLHRAFLVSADPLAHRVMERMLQDSKPLSEHGWEAVTGTIVWNRVKPLIHDSRASGRLPLIWSRGVRGFRFTGLGNRGGESAFCELVDRTRAIVSRGDALLVKRLTAREEPRRIVACRLPAKYANSKAGYFGENHVNLVRPTKTSNSLAQAGSSDAADSLSLPSSGLLDIDALLGLLNSRLFDTVFRALNGNTQVSATELEMLPIRLAPELEKIAEQARTLTEAGGDDDGALRELNCQVYELYGIDKADADAIGYGS